MENTYYLESSFTSSNSYEIFRAYVEFLHHMKVSHSGLAQLFFSSYKLQTSANDKQENVFQDSIQVRMVTKGTILLRAGEPGNTIYYVRRGLLRTYTVDKKGKEHSFMFAPEGWFFSDFESAFADSLSMYFIDAIEDSEIEVAPKHVLTTWKPSYEGQKHIVETLRKRVSVLEHRIILLQSASANERYQHFVETYPNIVQRVSQKMIASYLGITPESLSRVRKGA